MFINIVASGPQNELPDLSQYSGEGTIWIGVDRGVFILLSLNIVPAIALGDFDSVTEEEFQLIKKEMETVKIFNPEKDETDMELALNWAIAQEPVKIRIFGATGGRIDHFLANIQLLIKPILESKTVSIEIIDKNNIVYGRGPGTYPIKRVADKKYVSFIPITHEVKNLTLKGFKYPLTNRHISIGTTLCISNELICDEGTFSFSEGILMVVRSSD